MRYLKTYTSFITEKLEFVQLQQIKDTYKNIWLINDEVLTEYTNKSLLDDIQTAAEKVDVTVTISTHKPKSISETDSNNSHSYLCAVDIHLINGIMWEDKNSAKDRNILQPIENFVKELKNLGYAINDNEKEKAVLYFDFKNGGHEDNIHITNKVEVTPDIKSKLINLSPGQKPDIENSTDDDYKWIDYNLDPSIKLNVDVSIVDWCIANKIPYQKEFRKKYAEKLGIENYRYLANQNSEMLRKMKEIAAKGELGKFMKSLDTPTPIVSDDKKVEVDKKEIEQETKPAVEKTLSNSDITKQDFWTLVAICSLEEGYEQGWADVAQSIYNRVGSGAYGAKTITKLILGELQYQPTWTHPRKGRRGLPNPEWANIQSLEDAAKATGRSEKYIKKVANAILDPKYQEEARNFIQGRTDFKAATEEDWKAKVKKPAHRRKKDNIFGWGYNYRGETTYNPPVDFKNISV